MALKKFAVLLMKVLVLPIVLEAHFYRGYDSYRQYYDRINSERLKYPVKTSEESYYDHNNVKKEINSRFGDDKHTNVDSSFVFPNDEPQARNGNDDYIDVIGPVATCDHVKQTFCEDVSNYPEEFVNQALAKNSSLLHYAYEDVLEIAPRTDTNENGLCISVERVIRPKAGQNLKNEWHFILQSNQSNFHQGVRIETCLDENTKCRLIDGFAEGYITTCKQKYIYRELSAISDNGEIIRDYFRFPASCCCHVEFNIDNEQDVRTRI
ncbi:protein spaetzle [Lasius niger]|uniref:Protein spaetzle n=1 Tax=Lasius niger TaxID=67767 RepID=A0A0J7KDG5_LASNI|nr:protein spaetzle [Lasius niger]